MCSMPSTFIFKEQVIKFGEETDSDLIPMLERKISRIALRNVKMMLELSTRKEMALYLNPM